MKSIFERLHDIYKTHDAMALVFKTSRQNINMWKKNGVPIKRALDVEKKTRGAITAMEVLKG